MLQNIRSRLRLPVLTASEKFALLTLILLLGGGALRAWEHAGVRIGPVRDWETLRQLVIRARSDLKKAGGEVDVACADEAVAGFSDTRAPSALASGPESGSESGPDILSAGFGGFGAGRSKARGTGAAGDSRKKAPARPVDLNTAGEKALLGLPGVGPSTAKAILAYRAAHGKFRSVDDLLQVKGIGPKKLESLRPFALAEQAPAAPAEKTEPQTVPREIPP